MTDILQHTERTIHPFIPFVRINRKTALYYLSKDRYGKYFDPKIVTGGTTLFESDFKQKWNLQMMYQNEMETQGKLLYAIFLQRDDVKDKRMVDYLKWLDWQWDLYNAYQKNFESEKMTFLQFVQSIFSYSEELTEPDCYGKNRKIFKSD